MCTAFHTAYSPPGRPDLLLKREVFLNRIADPDVTAGFLFRESHTDACIYHELPLYGYFKDGGSPLSVAVAMREKWPDRVFIYGAISPHQPNALERVDYLVEEVGVSGLKLYPHDLVAGELCSIQLNDSDLLYPIFERAAAHGLRTIAIHKALVMGPVPIEPYYVNDVGDAARAFPDLIFEIVHGGLAFLEEAAYLVQYHPNVTVSLEATSALLFKAPWKFAEIIGTLMDVGAADRIIWGLGGAALHSRAFEERMWAFEIPDELQVRYGLPPLTEAGQARDPRRERGEDPGSGHRLVPSQDARRRVRQAARARACMVVPRRGCRNARERGRSGVSGAASDADPLRETTDAILKVLEGIIDPCSQAAGAPVGLVSMGLVRDVSVSWSARSRDRERGARDHRAWLHDARDLLSHR